MPKKEEKIVIAITANRRISAVDRDMISILVALACPMAKMVRIGGAIGGDDAALEGCIRYLRQEKKPQLQIRIIVPDTLKAQPREARGPIEAALKEFPNNVRVVEMGNPIRKSDGYKSFSIRNLRLLKSGNNVANRLLVFMDTASKGGGAYNCQMSARKMGIPITLYPLKGGD